MTVPGYYRTRMTSSFNRDALSEECGVCEKTHSPLSFTIVTLWTKKQDTDFDIGEWTPPPRWESEDKFTCSRDCLMACLTTFMIEQEACGKVKAGATS